ncbi:hypothetical protein [Streptomyces glebosus]|nr:hypothetical protein [Streptomyces glebosus]
MPALQRTAGNAAVTRLLEDGRRDGATDQEAVQRAVHGGTPGEVVQRAEEEATGGHGGIKDRVGGKIKEKPTNDVERDFSAGMRAGKHPGQPESRLDLGQLRPVAHAMRAAKSSPVRPHRASTRCSNAGPL